MNGIRFCCIQCLVDRQDVAAKLNLARCSWPLSRAELRDQDPGTDQQRFERHLGSWWWVGKVSAFYGQTGAPGLAWLFWHNLGVQYFWPMECVPFQFWKKKGFWRSLCSNLLSLSLTNENTIPVYSYCQPMTTYSFLEPIRWVTDFVEWQIPDCFRFGKKGILVLSMFKSTFIIIDKWEKLKKWF